MPALPSHTSQFTRLDALATVSKQALKLYSWSIDAPLRSRENHIKKLPSLGSQGDQMYDPWLRKLPLCCALSLFALSQIAFAQDASAPQFPASDPSVTGRIICHGVSTVPLTADSEQALPLHIVMNLECGDEVALLSDLQGYTTYIRTANGTTGYVVSTYVQKAPPSRRMAAPMTVKNGVARWRGTTIGCDQFIDRDGSSVQSLTLKGVTVQVSIHDTGWMFRANVTVANNGAQSIDIDPSKFMLDLLGRHGRPLPYRDPTDLAASMTDQALLGDANASRLNTQARAASTAKNDSGLNLNYTTSTNSSRSSQESLIPQQTVERKMIRNQKGQILTNIDPQIQSLALKSGTIQPNDTASGAVWFNGDKNPEQLVLRIPIDDIVFEFPVTLKQQK